MGSMQVCMANADCPAGQTCNMIGGGGGGGMGGGKKICGAPPCTAGSCGAGMVCCEGRAGGIAACAPAGAMGCNVICAPRLPTARLARRARRERLRARP